MHSLKMVSVFCFLFVISGKDFAQQSNYADSILTQLKLLKGGDSKYNIYFDSAIALMGKNKTEVLLENKSIMSKLDHLQDVLDESKYCTLFATFYNSHFSLDSMPNEALIKFGRDYIEKNKTGYSAGCQNTFLHILRQTRIPYRNSSHLYEGIEYYINLGNYFISKNDQDGAATVYSVLAGFYYRIGLSEKAEYSLLKSLSFLDDNPVTDSLFGLLGTSGKTNRYMILGSNMVDDNRPEIAEKYLRLAINEFNKLNSPLLFEDAPYLFLQMAKAKTLMKSDSSNYYYDKVSDLLNIYKLGPLEHAWYYIEKGKDFLSKDQNDSASYYISKAKMLKNDQHLGITSPWGELTPYYYAADLALRQNNPKLAIQLLQPEIQELRAITAKVAIINELQLLAKAYAASGMYKEGFNTQQELFGIKDRLAQETENARSLSFDIEKKMQDNENNIALLKAQDEGNKKTKYYLFGITALLTLFAITLGIAIRNKQRSNNRLTTKNTEIVNALEQLKQTQTQLIQSEKMASLGELTAGIAHEIQNPLNFVNNFSEVNKELLVEMKEEMDKGNLDDAKTIANDVIDNEEKIIHHGRRADTIVKGMLQHSRSSNGLKEPTDINALCDEYLRLSYHGLRAKDKSFNATMKTDFDESVGNINIIPQDIGRVILNLINNAFYVVDEKKKQNPDFEPVVTVSTKRLSPPLGDGRKVEIKVADNGNGIPQKVLDKIFQPFFTTKPTGQGTGLGLSLSYDIVKAHGGELKVQTKENEGTEFIIVL
jgi:signal transduction histidine kinase